MHTGTQESGYTVIATHKLLPTKVEMFVFNQATKLPNSSQTDTDTYMWHASSVDDDCKCVYVCMYVCMYVTHIHVACIICG